MGPRRAEEATGCRPAARSPPRAQGSDQLWRASTGDERPGRPQCPAWVSAGRRRGAPGAGERSSPGRRRCLELVERSVCERGACRGNVRVAEVLRTRGIVRGATDNQGWCDAGAGARRRSDRVPGVSQAAHADRQPPAVGSRPRRGRCPSSSGTWSTFLVRRCAFGPHRCVGPAGRATADQRSADGAVVAPLAGAHLGASPGDPARCRPRPHEPKGLEAGPNRGVEQAPRSGFEPAAATATDQEL